MRASSLGGRLLWDEEDAMVEGTEARFFCYYYVFEVFEFLDHDDTHLQFEDDE